MKSLQWHEPGFYKRAVARRWNRQNPWESTKFAALAFVTILVLRFMAQFGEAKPNLPGWPKAVVLASVIAVFLAYVLPWLILRLPNSLVILSPKGVNNNVVGKGVRITFWPWSEIACFSGSVEIVGNRTVQILSLHGEDGGVLATFGLSRKVSLEEIEQYVQSYDKPLHRDSISTG